MIVGLKLKVKKSCDKGVHSVNLQTSKAGRKLPKRCQNGGRKMPANLSAVGSSLLQLHGQPLLGFILKLFPRKALISSDS